MTFSATILLHPYVLLNMTSKTYRPYGSKEQKTKYLFHPISLQSGLPKHKT